MLPHDAQSERLFFALWPGDSLRQQLLQHGDKVVGLLASAADGRRLPRENLHMTLAFLGRTDARQRRCIESVADAIRCPRFELQLNRSGYWPRPRVLWISPADMPEPLIKLAADLHSGAKCCGLQLDARPYQAHVTLARKLAYPPQDFVCQPLSWSVDRFVLVRSITLPQGVKYEVVGEWALSAE